MVDHFVSMQDAKDDLGEILTLAREFKTGGEYGEDFRDRTLGMIFEKSSTRTRVSFEVAMNKMGGQAIFLSKDDIQLGRGETIEDTALTLSRYVDAISYRAYDHENIEDLARHAEVPVINALSDREHPCQILADLLTVLENFDQLEGISLAYVGDGNNMAHSYLLGCAIAGLELRVATPVNYEPSEWYVEQAKKLEGDFRVGHDLDEAVEGADVVATDTWVSMGDETEKEQRLKDFQGWTIDDDVMAKADDDAIFLHCLPAYYGNEVTRDVAHGPQSRIFDQAENRLWSEMALLDTLVKIA